jgi:hypothetical protein
MTDSETGCTERPLLITQVGQITHVSNLAGKYTDAVDFAGRISLRPIWSRDLSVSVTGKLAAFADLPPNWKTG